MRVWDTPTPEDTPEPPSAGRYGAQRGILDGVQGKVEPPSTPYVRHSDSSMEAAVEIEPRAGTLLSMVLDCLRAVGPMTDQEMQLALGMDPSTQRPRRVDLVNRGLVRDSGKTRRTRSGRKATVWEVC